MAAAVLVLALWPALHFVLVKRFELNPWNWFGWAMYTQPVERIEATAFSLDGRPLTPDGLSERQLDHLQLWYRRWSQPYIAVDARSEPRPFARAVLEVRPDWPGVRIEVRRIGLDRASATVTVREHRVYTYRREDL